MNEVDSSVRKCRTARQLGPRFQDVSPAGW